MRTAIDRLLSAIGYPDRGSEGSLSFTLRVDGAEILAEEFDGRLVLSLKLKADEGELETLAGYALGRMLRERATLSWDNGPVLWQDAPADAGEGELVRLFETFMNSCDWWRDRVDALHEGGQQAPEITMIRP